MKFTKRPDERYEIRLSGTGGQGIITAGMILGEACAFHAGLNTCMTQSYGPEARGGACRAELVVSNEEIDAPKPTSIDLLLAMSQESYDKYRNDIKEWGILVVDSSLVTFEPSSNTFPLPFTAIAREKVGFAVTANIVAVGFIAALTGLATLEQMKEVVAKKVPPGTEKTNFKALEIGFEGASGPISSTGLSISDYIVRDFTFSAPDDSIHSVVEKMAKSGGQSSLILDEGKLVGIFTFGDTARAISLGHDLKKTSVKKVMSKNVLTIHKATTLGKSLLLMEEHNYKTLPVVDDEGSVVGVLSYYVIHGKYSDENQLKDEVDFLDAARTMITGDRWSALRTIASAAKTLPKTALAIEAAHKLAQRKLDNIVVIDEEETPIGIITERDFCCRLVLRGLNPNKVTVEKVMTRKPAVLSTSASISDAYSMMISGGFHHLPLVGKQGKLRGCVTLADIAQIVHSRYYLNETYTQDQVPSYDDK